MVDQLNDIFSQFDVLAAKYGCEKIRTIGDAYMVASGVPVERDDHAIAAAALALEMLDSAQRGPFTFRIGINSGPVVAGLTPCAKCCSWAGSRPRMDDPMPTSSTSSTTRCRSRVGSRSRVPTRRTSTRKRSNDSPRR